MDELKKHIYDENNGLHYTLPAPELVAMPLRRHPQCGGRQRAELSSRLMNPGSRSMTR